MKKLFLFLIIGCSSIKHLHSQVIFNELQNLTNGSNTHFVELYNSSGSSQSLDCYSLVTMRSYTSASQYSFYVLNFNDLQINPGGFFVIDGSNANSVASVTQYSYLNNAYSITPVSLNSTSDLFFLGGNNNSDNIVALLFKNGQLADGFGGRRSLQQIQTFLGGLANFSVQHSCKPAETFTVNFQTLRNQVINTATEQGGTKSYSRSCDGPCFAWTTLPSTKGGSNNGTTCVAQNPPSWTFSSLSYRDANNNTIETEASNNTITQGALAFNSGGQTATVSLTASNFSNIAYSVWQSCKFDQFVT